MEFRRGKFEELVTPILTKPGASFDYKLGPQRTRAFAGVAEGREVIVFVAKDGEYAGKVIGSFAPQGERLEYWRSLY